MCGKNTLENIINTADTESGGEQTRVNRLGISVPPEAMNGLPESAGAWHETREEVARALAWGERKGRLIAWVRETVRRRLSYRERRCIELHFFEGLSCREAAARAGTSASSMHRGLRRALDKLRDAAETDPSVSPLLRRR
jgi:DNA-directed RNA polymerase specialized sigma24 family protein